MERWMWALILAIPLALLQTLIFGSGDVAEMLGECIGGIILYGVIWYVLLAIGGWTLSLFRKEECATEKMP